MELLEYLVATYGLPEVVSSLSYICSEKSLHIAAHWRNKEVTANLWMLNSVRLDKLSVNMRSNGHALNAAPTTDH